MRRFIQGLGLLIAAVLIQIFASHKVPAFQRSVDLVLLVVVYYGSSGVRVGSMVAGAAGGVLEDLWSDNLMGLHGLTKTLIGYLLGGLGSRFDLTSPSARLMAVFLATVVEKLVEPLVVMGLGLRAVPPNLVELIWRVIGNLLVGALFFFSLAGKGKIEKPKPVRRRRRRPVTA
jgi:rod shape-determining protein MreD